jgi:hypothetical protein
MIASVLRSAAQNLKYVALISILQYVGPSQISAGQILETVAPIPNYGKSILETVAHIAIILYTRYSTNPCREPLASIPNQESAALNSEL